MASISNLALMRTARERLSPHWGIAVLTSFIYALLVGLPAIGESLGGEFVVLLLTGPLELGFSYFVLTVVAGSTPELKDLFKGFTFFLNAFLAYLIQGILIIVGIILFIVPGIVIGLGLSMTFFIMAEKPEQSFTDALQESWELTKGNRLKILGLFLRFIPWYILGALCFGVGILVVHPWCMTALAALYQELKQTKNS